MFCSKCGARNSGSGNYCHKCGSPLFGEANAAGKAALTQEQRQLAEELLPIDQKPNECHACGRTAGLYGWDFGLGKKLSSQRAWGETAVSAAVSAITIPLIGAGRLELPGKRMHLRVLRLRLILCDDCSRKQVAYTFHPWWNQAFRLGYTEFLTPDDLKNLTV